MSNTGELIFTLKKPIQVYNTDTQETVETAELVLVEPKRQVLDNFYNFQALGMSLLRHAQESRGTAEDVSPVVPTEAVEEKPDDYKDMAKALHVLVFSSYGFMQPSEFINAFKKVIYCKNISSVRAFDKVVTEPYFGNVGRSDLARMACEYFAFFGMADFMT